MLFVEGMLLFNERFISERINQRGPIGVHPSSVCLLPSSRLTARAAWTAATTMEGLRSGA